MGLAPFLGLCIEKLKTEYALSELIHHVDPEHGVNFMSLKSKKAVNFRKLAQKVSTSISAALFETG
jgi:hypothetical protein